MRVHLGSDHAGFALKAALATRLREPRASVASTTTRT